MKLPRYRKCFVCGTDNQCGLQVQPELEENSVVIRFAAEEKHCGFRHWLHGGVTASLLDEAMFWAAAVGLQQVVATASLSIRYRKPIPIGAKLKAVAYLTSRKNVLASTRGKIVDEDGIVYAEAEARYAAIRPREHTPGAFLPENQDAAAFDLSKYHIEPTLVR